MRTGFLVITLVLASLLPPAAQTPAQTGSDPWNFIEAISLPPDKQTGMTPYVVRLLAKSEVPTQADAEKIAYRYVIDVPGRDTKNTLGVTGLFLVGVDVPAFAAKGDLVWEVREHQLPGRLMRVLWISTTTKALRVVFP